MQVPRLAPARRKTSGKPQQDRGNFGRYFVRQETDGPLRDGKTVACQGMYDDRPQRGLSGARTPRREACQSR